jgi:hypothetical protein
MHGQNMRTCAYTWIQMIQMIACTLSNTHTHAHTHTHLDLGANSLEHIDGHTRFEVLNRIHFRHQSTSHLVREKKAESKKHMICPRIHSCCSIAMYRVCDRKMWKDKVILPYEDATITQKNMEHQAHVCANASNTRVRARTHTHTHTHTR